MNLLKSHHTAPIVSVILCGLIVTAGVISVQNFISSSRRDHMDLVMALTKSNEETALLKVIDDRMKVPMETKVILARTIISVASVKRIPLDVICGLIDVETGQTWDPKKISKKGARGLFQVMPATGRVYLRAERIDPTSVVDSLMDPVTSALVGISALADFHEQAVMLKQERPTDFGVTLAMYNQGPKADVPTDYSQSVLEAAKKFKALGV